MAQYDYYGKIADIGVSETIQNGRYPTQQEAEKNVPTDVIKKIKANQNDTLLDIGCGLGLNLIPLSKIVKSASACDHPKVIEQLKNKIDSNNVTFYGCNFLETDINEKFSKVLCYSVLPALPDHDTLFSFVDKALSYLKSDGLMLIGDLSNVDKKDRFLQSERGKIFQKEWEESNKTDNNENDDIRDLQTEKTVIINDQTVYDILKMIREKGFHAYLLDQPQNLPFGNTREDILVVGPEYSDE